ncbi:oxidoreductase, partial [Streptomyces sp. NPDC059371]
MSTAQHKIGSGFGARSTADDVLGDIDLSGKLAIVTGGYSGLGLETRRGAGPGGGAGGGGPRRAARPPRARGGGGAAP